MTVESPPPRLTVGVLMSTKKAHKHALHLPHPEFRFLALQVSDLTAARLRTLGVQLIIHKISDLLLSPSEMAVVRQELAAWAEGVVVDDLERVEVLGDRWRTCLLLQQLTSRASPPTPIRLPLTGLASAMPVMRFPLIRKPIVACSQADSHSMCLFHSLPLLQLAAPQDKGPYILQEYIPHHGLLYKVYIIGDAVRIQLRPSLHLTENTPSSTPLHFDSQSMKHKELIPVGSLRHRDGMARIEPWRADIEAFSRTLQHELRLTLFGWDLILDERDNLPYIIDVNYFPGFDEVDFMPLFTTVLRAKLDSADGRH